MPTYRDEGVVLRTHKLGEADRIVTVLTKKHGKVRAVAKGVRRTSSKFGARLEPFMVADIQFYEGKTLDTIQQAETLASYGANIVDDYPRFTAANVMVETADKVTEHEASGQQYLLLLGALRSLSLQEHPTSLTLDSYLLRALSIAGWAPTFLSCSRCGTPGVHDSFVVQLGGMLCSACTPPGSAHVSEDVVHVLTALLAGEWEELDSYPESAWKKASTLVSAYTQWHLERGLKSLEHVSP
jgi:DNA repair protein RecO (recombination protein O)